VVSTTTAWVDGGALALVGDTEELTTLDSASSPPPKPPATPAITTAPTTATAANAGR